MKIRTALAAGASMLLAGGLSAALGVPAYAADGIDVAAKVTGSMMSVEAEGKWFRVDFSNVGSTASGDTTVRYDFSGLDSSRVVADTSIYDGACDISGKIVTCHWVGFLPGESTFDFVYLKNVGKETGSAGSFSVSFTTPGDTDHSNDTTTAAVEQVIGGWVDLVSMASDLVGGYSNGKVVPLKPGEQAPLGWAVSNEGDATVQGIKFTITLPAYASFDSVYDICEINIAETEYAVCTDPDVVLAPGEAYLPEQPVLVSASGMFYDGPAALPGGLVSVNALKQVSEVPTGKQAEPADGFKVAEDLTEAQIEARIADLIEDLVPNAEQAAEADPGDNDAAFAMHVGAPPTVDQAITVSQGIGRVGDTVKIFVKVTNVGKASSGPQFYIKTPAGTSFVAPAVKPGVGNCIDRSGEGPAWEYTGETQLACGFESELQPGRTLTRELLVHIDSAPIGNDGLAEVITLVGKDGNPKNDTAKVIIKIGTPPAGGNNGGNGGGLPVTGDNTALIAGIGGGVVALGAVLFLVARRRKVSTEEIAA
ncbi:hypothetical protein Cme02nite_59910 [Catellatospora methionotrophica]|uniref:Gram-positive cocci surface proteins LPxTG domain-containing protein n=1 Tax=Catellatospora methionotrophica TaxID=121620 RepID=A0A8J3PIE3_9ACTN|nr:LPXTG cell wall anchor domain-containing protein [Catellatospora methionotrophica]GIG17659.1 hypothetical protein Cme02nite_59910 [Catellatospora methionotrophica]